MLRRFAEETTVHGIKEAFFASWVGRVFWFLVFLGGVAAMVFQLETIFLSYINGLVGTKTTSTANVDEIELPSIYYCHRHWQPFPEAYQKFTNCLKGRQEFDNNLYETCYDDFANASLTEEIINGLFLIGKDMLKMEISESAVHEYTAARPKVILKRFKEVYNEIDNKYNGDIAAYIQSKTIGKKADPATEPATPPVLDSYNTSRPRPNGTMLAHGVITKFKETLINEMFRKANGMALTTYAFDAFDMREGSVSINQNGVCWEIRPEKESSKPWDVSAIAQDHQVIHLGGYIYTLNPLVARQGLGYTADLLPAGFLPFRDKFPGASASSFNNMRSYNFIFSTDLFIAPQAQQLPFFGEGLKLTGDVRNVVVKFWTKKTIHHNRGSYHCRKDWSSLDVAHCNQEQRLKTDPWEFGCKVYLPASRHYAATPLNETCKAANIRGIILSDLQDLQQDSFLDDQDQKFLDQLVNTIPEMPPSTLEVKAFVEDHHPDCPHTCSEVNYKVEATNRKVSSVDVLDNMYGGCLIGVNYVLGSTTATTDDDRWMDFFVRTMNQSIHSGWKKSTGIDLPCTQVSLMQNDIGGDGIIIEEYPLYSFADLLSNIGGTLGLWIGASVISFIQCIYLFCLERLLTKRENVVVAPKEMQVQRHCQYVEGGVTETREDTAVLKKEDVEVATGGIQGQAAVHGGRITREKKDTKVYPEDEVLQMLDKSESYARRYDRY